MLGDLKHIFSSHTASPVNPVVVLNWICLYANVFVNGDRIEETLHVTMIETAMSESRADFLKAQEKELLSCLEGAEGDAAGAGKISLSFRNSSRP
jgi:hypothetical protein